MIILKYFAYFFHIKILKKTLKILKFAKCLCVQQRPCVEISVCAVLVCSGHLAAVMILSS